MRQMVTRPRGREPRVTAASTTLTQPGIRYIHLSVIFVWDDWNKEHVKKHGSRQSDASYVVEHSEDPFPREIGNDKYLVWGRTHSGDLLEVVFALRLPAEIEFTSLSLLDWSAFIDYGVVVGVYICHAMPMKAKQVSQYRKLRRKK